MKILHWPSSYPDPDKGKHHDCIFVKEHIQSLASFCENRVLYIPTDQPSGNRLFETKHSIEDNIPTDRIYFKTIRPLWITNVYIRLVLIFYFLHLILKERYYPQILHIHFHQAGLMALLFCKIFRINMVVTEHWTAFIGYPTIPEARFKKAAKVFEFSKAILPVSSHLLKGIEYKTNLSLNKKSAVVNNSVDAGIFHLRPNYEIKDTKIVLMVVRLDEQKDLPNLFQALGILELIKYNFMVRIVGKGDPAQYSQILQENQVINKVEFLGEKSKSEIAEEMRKADILCLSSISENSPCVIGEALCTGLPIVSTNVGGIPELLDETNGILVPPKNPEKLAEALYNALYVKQFDRESISIKAQYHFSYNAIGKQIFQVYENITSKTNLQ